jgi:hypothetical protein
MKDKATRHFKALRQINPLVKQSILLDYDSEETAINPKPDQFHLNEWKRKNIDNYLLVPDAWKRAISIHFNEDTPQATIFSEPYIKLIDKFFSNENLTLPPQSTWRTVNASIFKILDGKKLLFENKNSLFQQIKDFDNGNIIINRTTIASAMKSSELHNDIVEFFENLTKIVEVDE